MLEKQRTLPLGQRTSREFQEIMGALQNKYNAVHEILLKKRLELGLSPEVAE